MASPGKLLEKILSYYEKKEYAEAEKGIDAMLGLYPGLNRALFLKAVVLEETGRREDAERYYREAGPSYTLMLRLAMQLQDVDPRRALVYFEKAGAADQGNNAVLLGMGTAYEKLGMAEEAGKCFGRLSLAREIFSKLLIPVCFLLMMVVGAVMLLQRGENALAGLVVVSAIVCLFWLRRDGKTALKLIRRKSGSG
jgi:tetratricopeptide (TPR) repeat protein